MIDIDAVLIIRDSKKKRMSEYIRSNGLLFAEEIRQCTAASSRSGLEAGVSGTPFDRQIQKILLADPLLLAQQGR